MTDPRPGRAPRDLDAFLREAGRFERETAYLRDPAFLRAVIERAGQVSPGDTSPPGAPEPVSRGEPAPPAPGDALLAAPGTPPRPERRLVLRALAGGLALAAAAALLAAVALRRPAPGPSPDPAREEGNPGGDATAGPAPAAPAISAWISPAGDAPTLAPAAWGHGQAFEFGFGGPTPRAAGWLFRIDAERPDRLGRFERVGGDIRGNVRGRLGAAPGWELFVLVLADGPADLQAIRDLSGCLTADDLYEMQDAAERPDLARVVAERLDAALKRAAAPWSGSPPDVVLLKTVPHQRP